jgi:lipopolysaccharide export system permease protein
MPILWRYLITDFLKITIACLLAFIAILLTMQLDEIAHFAALGAPLTYILLFTIHQIPYIIPIALPLSCLIASLILVQRLTLSHEFTALRASGFGLTNIFAPIWMTAAFLALINFLVASEFATHSHFQNNLLKSELRSINPLLILNNKHLMRLKGFYFESIGSSRKGESSTDVILALPGRSQERINLMLAKELKADKNFLSGDGVTLISAIPSSKEDDFDQLVIENMKKSITHVSDFSDMLQQKVWTIHNDYLTMPLLLARMKEQRALLEEARQNEDSAEQIKLLAGHLNRSQSEIMRRLSIAIAVFSFTMMGTAFGISLNRRRSYLPLYCAIALTTLYLMAFFAAKGNEHQKWLAAQLFLLPHLIIITASLYSLRRVAKGRA